MDGKAREQLARAGVVADISGVFVTCDGEPVQSRITDRIIAINAKQMDAIDEVIAIAYGMPKVPAVRAAVRSGLVNGLVTHSPLAQALLADEPA
jgi:DNA-binding transcriptional regulator LsrR (DeoR family)